MEITELVQKIEALLFIKGQTLSLGELVTLTREPKSKIAEACSMLQEKHRADGIVVIFNNEEITPSLDLMRFLGITSLEELSDKASVEASLQTFVQNSAQEIEQESV